MKELKTTQNSHESPSKVQGHSSEVVKSQSSQNLNRQRVSVRDVIENHYRKGK